MTGLIAGLVGKGNALCCPFCPPLGAMTIAFFAAVSTLFVHVTNDSHMPIWAQRFFKKLLSSRQRIQAVLILKNGEQDNCPQSPFTYI